MTTLIAVYTTGGCVGRCDAKCYDANSPDCDCVCGGRNHGAGLERAAENTRECVEDWIQDYAERKKLKQYEAKLNRDLVDQFSLFDTANFTHIATPTTLREVA